MVVDAAQEVFSRKILTSSDLHSKRKGTKRYWRQGDDQSLWHYDTIERLSEGAALVLC